MLRTAVLDPALVEEAIAYCQPGRDIEDLPESELQWWALLRNVLKNLQQYYYIARDPTLQALVERLREADPAVFQWFETLIDESPRLVDIGADPHRIADFTNHPLVDMLVTTADAHAEAKREARTRNLVDPSHYPFSQHAKADGSASMAVFPEIGQTLDASIDPYLEPFLRWSDKCELVDKHIGKAFYEYFIEERSRRETNWFDFCETIRHIHQLWAKHSGSNRQSFTIVTLSATADGNGRDTRLSAKCARLPGFEADMKPIFKEAKALADEISKSVGGIIKSKMAVRLLYPEQHKGNPATHDRWIVNRTRSSAINCTAGLDFISRGKVKRPCLLTFLESTGIVERPSTGAQMLHHLCADDDGVWPLPNPSSERLP